MEIVSEKKLTYLAEEVISILGIEYAPVDFAPAGFKVLLKTPLNSRMIEKVGTKMMEHGFLSTYIQIPEDGYVSNLTVINFNFG